MASAAPATWENVMFKLRQDRHGRATEPKNQQFAD